MFECGWVGGDWGVGGVLPVDDDCTNRLLSCLVANSKANCTELSYTAKETGGREGGGREGEGREGYEGGGE